MDEPFMVGERVFYYLPHTSPEKFYGYVAFVRPFVRLSGEYAGWEYKVEFDDYGEHWYINTHDRKVIFAEGIPRKPSWEA